VSANNTKADTRDADTARLLEPLSDTQQRLVETIGTVYRTEPGVWPTFDYIEWKLDEERIDALETFLSFPTVDLESGAYSALWSSGGPRAWPRADYTVGLTVLGINHCKALQSFPANRSVPQIDLVRAFIDLLSVAAKRRRDEPASPTTVRTLEIRSDEVFNALTERYRFDQLPVRLLYDLTEKEPALWGAGGSLAPDETTWTRGLPGRLKDFEDVSTLDEYLGRLLMLRQPAAQLPPATPSPLDLVAALDYLDVVWQHATGEKHLFRFDSMEQTAKLAFPATTAEEFDSRLSVLGDILRSSRDVVPAPKKKRREKPLDGLKEHLKKLLGASAAPRIERNVRTLELVLFVRDVGQHSAAGRGGAVALTELGVGFPVADRAQAWETIKAETIEAVNGLREELRAFGAHAAATD
jgi:hypothetical protein